MKVKLAFLIISVMLFAGNRTFARQRQSDGATATGQKQPPTATLAGVRSIYIAPMPGGFDQYLTAEILRRLPQGVTLTQKQASADAVLEGVDENNAHGISRTVNQVFGVGGGSSAAVKLLSQDGQILWAAEKSDHTIPLFGTLREHGVSKVAARIAKNLTGAIRAAQKRAKRKR